VNARSRRSEDKRMRFLCVVSLAAVLIQAATAQTDWPVLGHDPGRMRYSPLKQINAKNVQQLRLVWTYDTQTTPPRQRSRPWLLRQADPKLFLPGSRGCVAQKVRRW
jgi:hypothetical protein